MDKQDEEMFYLRVKWQMELERERAIELGLKLDEELHRLDRDEDIKNNHAES